MYLLENLTVLTIFQVNEAKERIFLFANISISVVTFAINLWAGLSIQRKERTRLHFLIICDCAANVVFCIHTSFLQSPWNILNSSMLCRLNIFVLVLLTAWNRLVPLAIAAFRYIMVCHAVFVQNHGGEKQVGLDPRTQCEWIKGLTATLSLVKINVGSNVVIGVENVDGNTLLGQSQPLHPPLVQPRAQPRLPCLHWQGRTFWVSIVSFSFMDQVGTFSAHYQNYLQHF